MNVLLNSKNKFLIVLFIYLTANSTLLLNFNGIYWDDWVLFTHSFSEINKMFNQAVGSSGLLVASIHYSLINFLGIYSYRLLTFILLFLSGLFIYNILKNTGLFSKTSLFFICVFYLLAPHFSGRVALIDFPYTLFLFVFFFAFFLLDSFRNQLSLPKRIVVLALFFLSFLVNSLLVFYALVLLYLFFHSYRQDTSFTKNCLSFIKIKLDFILLPLVFYLIKSIYFKPSGLYAGYNDVSVLQLFNVKSYLLAFDFSFFQAIVDSLQALPGLLSLALALPFVALLLGFKSDEPEPQNSDKYKNHIFYFFGILAFALGAAPYIVTGKVPVSYGFNDRFQLLLPLGFSFMLWFGIKTLFNKKGQIVLSSFLVIVFVMHHIKEQAWYNVDYYHQLSIKHQFEINPDIKNNSTFIIDSRLGKNLKHRILSVYELNGIAKLAYGNADRLFVNQLTEIEAYKTYCQYENYNCLGWQESQPITLILSPSDESLFKDDISFTRSIKSYLKLKYYEIFNKSKFNSIIDRLVMIEVVK